MFKRQDFQALGSLSVYPTIPAIWPNRATRRAIQQNRESRLSSEWRQFLASTKNATAIRKAIVAL